MVESNPTPFETEVTDQGEPPTVTVVMEGGKVRVLVKDHDTDGAAEFYEGYLTRKEADPQRAANKRLRRPDGRQSLLLAFPGARSGRRSLIGPSGHAATALAHSSSYFPSLSYQSSCAAPCCLGLPVAFRRPPRFLGKARAVL